MPATGRMYTCVFQAVSVSAQQDLFELQPADDKPIRIHAIYISQSGTADFGDSQEEGLRIAIIRGHTTSGSVGGTNPTPRPLNRTDVAAGFVCEINNTTIASVGTPIQMHEECWNVRVPYVYLPTPEMRIEASQADTTIVVRLLTTPADAISTTSGTIYVEELG